MLQTDAVGKLFIFGHKTCQIKHFKSQMNPNNKNQAYPAFKSNWNQQNLNCV